MNYLESLAEWRTSKYWNLGTWVDVDRGILIEIRIFIGNNNVTLQIDLVGSDVFRPQSGLVIEPFFSQTYNAESEIGMMLMEFILRGKLSDPPFVLLTRLAGMDGDFVDYLERLDE
jgi:hypothetical protein